MQIAVILICLFASSQSYAFSFFSGAQRPVTIMIDPAGDSQNTGRQLDDAFERGLTLQCAEKLKAILEERNPKIRVVITRHPGESVAPLQNANFANRLDAHLFLTLHFFQESATKPRVYLYHFSYGNEFIGRSHELAFIPYDQAYLYNAQTTQHMISSLHSSLAAHKKQFDCKGPYKLPLKSLIGITSPAMVIEAGLKHKDDWLQLIEPLVVGVEGIIKTS